MYQFEEKNIRAWSINEISSANLQISNGQISYTALWPNG